MLPISLCALLSLLPLGCGQPKPAPRPLRIGIHGDPVSLDPHLQNDILTYSILSNVYEALTVFDAELRLLPGLAADWESPDELTTRFRLRKGARFHDGRNVEAADVVFSLERARTHPNSSMASYMVEVAGVKALDTRTVEVKTRRPFPGLLNKLAFILVIPRGSPQVLKMIVGSGPYRVARYEKGRFLRLEPVSSRELLPIEFHPVGKAGDRIAGLLDGALDIVQDLPPSDAVRLRSDSRVKVVARSSAVVEYLHFLASEARFKDRRVREAISLALDRRRLVETTLAGFGQPASQLVGQGVFGYDPALRAQERDLPRAQRLLMEAGYPNGFHLTLEYREGRHGDEIARQLGELGLRVSLKSSPWPELYARLAAEEVPFYYGGVVAPSAEASDILDSFVHSRDQVRGYGKTNFLRYRNLELDRLIEQVSTSPRMAERLQLLQKGMRIVSDDLYLIPLDVPQDLYGVAKDVVWQPRLDRCLLGKEMRRSG